MSIKQKNMLALFWAIFLDKISVNITFPVLTFVFFSTQSHLFDPSVSQIDRGYWYGVCLSIPNLLGIVSVPLLSIFSDSFGRKVILMLTALAGFVFAISCAAGILLGSLFLLLFGKFMGGFLSRTDAVAQAAVADASESHNKLINMARLQVVISVGAALGPFIGGYYAEGFWFPTLNYALPYMIAAGFSCLAWLSLLFFFKDSQSASVKVMQNFRGLWQLFLEPKVLKISIFLALVQVSWGAYYQFIPPALKNVFHFSVVSLGLFVGLIAVWLAIASAFVMPLLRRYWSHQQINFYACQSLLLGFLLTISAQWVHANIGVQCLLWAGSILISASDVLIYSIISTEYSDAVPSAQQGAVMGICFIVFSIVWASVALVGGYLSGLAAFLPIELGVVGIIAALLFIIFGK